MPIRSLHLTALLAALCFSAAESLLAQDNLPGAFQARTFASSSGQTMPFRLFIPKNYDPRQSYPLLLWLHGAAGRGADNFKQISAGNSYAALFFTAPENQARFPAFVVAPQCPEEKFWTDLPTRKPSRELLLALEILEQIQGEFSIDPRRIYVAGQSMGGAGTWALIAQHPARFAAAVPLCGPVDIATAATIAQIPVWVFHGGADLTVPVGFSRRMVEAIRLAGGKPKYTEYPGIGHQVWEKAFAEPGLLEWLFAQKRAPEPH